MKMREKVGRVMDRLRREIVSQVAAKEQEIIELESRLAYYEGDSSGPYAKVISIRGNRVEIEVDQFGEGATWSTQFYEGQTIEFREAIK